MIGKGAFMLTAAVSSSPTSSLVGGVPPRGVCGVRVWVIRLGVISVRAAAGGLGVAVLLSMAYDLWLS